MIPNVRAVVSGILHITIADIAQAIAAGYDKIKVFTDTAEDGSFATEDGTVDLVAGQTGYLYRDADGSSSTWYKAALYKSSDPVATGTKSAARQYGTQSAYCTAFEVRQELATGSGQASISQEHDEVVWNMCEEASRMIDDYKRVDHGAYLASASSVRYFTGSGGVRQRIDPAVSISEVAVEETDGSYTTWTEDTDFFTWPYHGDGPILRLDVNTKSGSTKSTWTPGPKRVKVTAVWGVSATVPGQVGRACLITAARWFKRAQAGWQDAGGMAEMGQLIYTKEMDPEARKLLDRAMPRRARL